MQAIWAQNLDGVIGVGDALPWVDEDDLKHFRSFTLGRDILVGNRTKHPQLKGRRVHVLSRSNMPLESAVVLFPCGVIIGGATILQLAMQYVDSCIVTRINRFTPATIERISYAPIVPTRMRIQHTFRLNAFAEVDVWF